ncbi:MAG: dockerin type I domain-containing protein [Candidatus Zixiibacteriota bacterium]
MEFVMEGRMEHRARFSRRAGILVLVGVVLISSTAAWNRGRDDQAIPRAPFVHPVENPRHLPLAGGRDESAGMDQAAPSIMDDRLRQVAPLRIRTGGAAGPVVAPVTVGARTAYDFQHNDDGSRTVNSSSTGGVVHFVWEQWYPIDCSIGQCSNRTVHYNAWNPAGGGGITLDPDGTDVGCTVGGDCLSSRAGFPRVDVSGGNLAQVVFHARGLAQQPAGDYNSWVASQGTPGLADWTTGEIPGSLDEESLWPGIGMDLAGSATKSPGDDVFHITAHPFVVNDRIYYWRRIGMVGAWVGPVCLDETPFVSYHPAPDPTSEKVSVAYVQFDGAADLVNVKFVTSANNGQDWIDADALNPGTCVGLVVNGGRQSITNYADQAGPQAWTEITSEYDFAGNYHVIWTEQVYANVSADARIRHWSDATGTITTVAQAIGYQNIGGDGARDIWLAYPQIGFGDGSTLCTDGPVNPGSAGATSNANYLYVTFEQYGGETATEANDASVTPQMNLEVYLGVSNDGGLTWAPPVNLTNTKTPGCDGTPGNECASERDPSIAKIVNDTIHLMYILDIDAGDAVFGQGIWTYNPVHYLRIPGGTDALYLCPAIAPSIALSLSNQDPDCEYHAPRGGSQTEALSIENLGNGALTGSVSNLGGAGWLQLITGAYTVNPGDPADVRTVTMDASIAPLNTVEGLYQETIRVTHNDTTRVSPIDIPVDFFVFDEFYCPEKVVLHTEWLWLGVSSTTRLGRNTLFPSLIEKQPIGFPQNPTAATVPGFTRLATDSSWSIYDGSLIIGIGQALPDTLVYRDLFGAGNGQPGFRAVGPLEVDTTAYGTGAGLATASASLVTVDSTIGIDVTYRFAQSVDSGEFVLVDYLITNLSPSAINGVAIGEACDFDVYPGIEMAGLQPEAQNTGHLNLPYNLVYQQGVDTVGHVISGLNTATRFKAGMSVLSCGQAPRAWVAPNSHMFYWYPGGGFHERYLWEHMTETGFELFPPDIPDPEEDLHSVVVFEQGLTLQPGVTRGYSVAFVSSNVGANDPADLIATTRKAWKAGFGWKVFTEMDSLASGVSAVYPYVANGTNDDGVGGGCCGCVVTEISDLANRFSTVGGGCEGAIAFDGTNSAGLYYATYRVSDLCNESQEDIVITIVTPPGECICPFESDINGDGIVDATDLAFVIDIVFFGATNVQDPLCPAARADFNADGFADATDLAMLIDHVFFGGDWPVDPCGW